MKYYTRIYAEKHKVIIRQEKDRKLQWVT